MQEIKNECLHQAFIAGAKEVMNNRLLLNQINVFPVADGDTGNNLYRMMDSIITYSEVKESLKATLNSISESAILGARGNSGLIFAQYIQGLSALDMSPLALNREHFIRAAENGVSYAYSAVESPVEGTMLTSMRVFYESLLQHNNLKKTFIEVVECAYLQVEVSVSQTTEQLINLKKASVVDSGAKAFAFFIKGFIKGLKGQSIILLENQPPLSFEDMEEHFSLEVDEAPYYRYCTEALLSKSEENFSDLKENFSSYSDSIIFSSGINYSRMHLHTNRPSEVFQTLSEKFEIKDQKVDDMLCQYMQLHDKKYHTVIVTDSIADLPQSIVDKGQVVVIPLDILIGDQCFIDGLTINNKMVFDLIKRKGFYPTTSQPSRNKVRKILTDLMAIYDDAVVINVSKKMSGTYHVISMEAQAFGNRIQVIDSKQNSVAQGLIVVEAINMLENGFNALQIRQHIEKIIPKSSIYVSVKNLDSMMASGRLNSHLGGLIKYLSLYPIISINQQGVGVVDQVVFGRKNRQKKLLKALMKTMKSHTIKTFAVTYVDNREEAEEFVQAAERLLKLKCQYVVPCSSVIALGAGKGAFAVAYIRK